MPLSFFPFVGSFGIKLYIPLYPFLVMNFFVHFLEMGFVIHSFWKFIQKFLPRNTRYKDIRLPFILGGLHPCLFFTKYPDRLWFHFSSIYTNVLGLCFVFGEETYWFPLLAYQLSPANDILFSWKLLRLKWFGFICSPSARAPKAFNRMRIKGFSLSKVLSFLTINSAMDKRLIVKRWNDFMFFYCSFIPHCWTLLHFFTQIDNSFDIFLWRPDTRNSRYIFPLRTKSLRNIYFMDTYYAFSMFSLNFMIY